MKRTAKNYAHVLYELLQEASEKEYDAVLKRFVEFVHEHHDQQLFKGIISEFSNYYNEQHNIKEVVITTSREVDKGECQHIEKQVQSLLGVIVEAQYRVDKALLGGIKVTSDDILIDASIQTQLQTLKNA